jgi:translation elongation factor EF-G
MAIKLIEQSSSSEHLLETEIKPKAKSDWKKLYRLILDVGKRDKSLLITVKRFSKKMILRGMSEGQLQSVLESAQREHGIDLIVSPVEIIYRLVNVRGAPQVLEPIMKIQISTPEKFSAVIKQGLHNRGGKIENQSRQDDRWLIDATVALVNLLGWENELRQATHGLATVTLKVDRYEPVELPDGDPPFKMAAAMRVR